MTRFNYLKCIKCVPSIVLLLCGTFCFNDDLAKVNGLSMRRRIIFPTNDNDDICDVINGAGGRVRGACKKLSECVTALERWKNENVTPKTCRFEKFEHFVCCELAITETSTTTTITPTTAADIFRTPSNMEQKRRSEIACESYNIFRVQVVHGEPTQPKEFPYMAALGWRTNFGNAINYRCGGALISHKYVLTAAHCSEMGGDSPIVVRLGGVNLTDSTIGDVVIKRIIVHPSYDEASLTNDIALVELQHDVSETPACVWSSNDIEHNNVTAIGYGQTKFAGISSNQLLKANLFLVTNAECKQYFAADKNEEQLNIESSHICAGDPEHLRDTCQGDSGGPIIMKVEHDSTHSYVVGITSFGRGCAGEPPSIYTRTSSYIDWIENIVWPKV